MKYEIDLSDEELEEILCKLANELEVYWDDGEDCATDALKSGFAKMYQLTNKGEKDIYYTTLVKKWVKKLGC